MTRAYPRSDDPSDNGWANGAEGLLKHMRTTNLRRRGRSPLAFFALLALAGWALAGPLPSSLLGTAGAAAQTAAPAATGERETNVAQADAPPSAATRMQRSAATQRDAACAGRTDVLGVSRVVEIDTSGGQFFGQLQYKDNDFLDDGEVVLTFDDGPLRRYTVPVLEALDAHCTKATFFMVGRMAVADPDLVRETAARGHTVGSHTWSHRNQRTLNGTLSRGEMELAISAISKAAGQPTAPFFRFPYLADSRAATAHLKARDHGIFSIDIDSRDFRTKNPADVQRVILNRLSQQRKGILLFHDIQPSTSGALRKLLGELKKRGFKVVHMISKSPVITLPEYDALADTEFERKRLLAARSPLARRAIVWPVATGDAAGNWGSAAPRTPSKAAATGSPVTVTPGPAGNTPAMLPSADVLPPTAEAPPEKPPRERWKTEEDESWQSRVFRN